VSRWDAVRGWLVELGGMLLVVLAIGVAAALAGLLFDLVATL
jgi:hypothetical protein